MADEMRGTVAIIGTRGYPSFYGGFETAVRHLVPYLEDDGWHVVVYGRPDATARGESADPRAEVIITRGVNSRALSTLSYGLTACLHAARRRPDVALVMNVANGFWLPLLRARGIPTVVNVDGLEWERDKWSRTAKRVFIAGARITARVADRLIFDAEAIRAYWQRRFHADGTFIPYGAGDEHDDGGPPLGLADRSYVLIVARFVPENSVDAFFDATEDIARHAPVVIVGSTGTGGEYDDRAAALAQAHERVTYLGHVSDDALVYSLWRHAGAYFHGHSVGGTNPALVQAMACGAPIIARNTVFNREVLADAGVFVEPTPAAITAATLALLAVPGEQERLSRAARARAVEAYGWAWVCGAYSDLLADACGR